MDAHHPNTPTRPRTPVTLGCPTCGSGIHLALLTSADTALRLERVVVHRGLVHLHVIPGSVPVRQTPALPSTLICTVCAWCAADDDWTGQLVPLGG